MSNTLVIASTNTVTLKGLKDIITGLYPVNATVVLTALLDTAGATVAGTANISMPYVSGTGRSTIYRGVIPHTVTLVAGSYTARVTVTDASGNVRRFDLAVIAG